MAVETRPLDLVDALPEEVGMSSERLQNVTRLVQRYIDDGRFSGAISMIARRDRVVHFETYGSMDDEAGKPMTHDAIVRAYSMTKPIASVALMQLYEEGRFQLDDPVSAYVPEFEDLKVFDGGDLATMGQPQFGETTMEGIGFGLGFAVLIDPTRAQLLGTTGEYYWGGAASTAFFVSPAEDLAVVFLTQLRPSSSYPIRRELRIATYQAITD